MRARKLDFTKAVLVFVASYIAAAVGVLGLVRSAASLG